MTAVLVATTGGHLTQLYDLAKRMKGSNRTACGSPSTRPRAGRCFAMPKESLSPISKNGISSASGEVLPSRDEFSPRNALAASSAPARPSPFRSCLTPPCVASRRTTSKARRGSEGRRMTGRILQRIRACASTGNTRTRRRGRSGGSVFDGFRASPAAGPAGSPHRGHRGGVGRSFPEMIEPWPGPCRPTPTSCGRPARPGSITSGSRRGRSCPVPS